MDEVPQNHRPQVPNDLQIHLILDNYATHKHEDVRSWLNNHPRFQVHFTPTSSSWLNLVERWFRELTDKALRRGVFHSVPDLVASIQEYIDAHNDDPKPYVLTATAESILAKVARDESIISNTTSTGQYGVEHCLVGGERGEHQAAQIG